LGLFLSMALVVQGQGYEYGSHGIFAAFCSVYYYVLLISRYFQRSAVLHTREHC
jgi:hypothetical protein